MSRPRFEELAWRDTPIGEISLRRRFDPQLGVDIFEVKIGDEFLMSSLFTVAEQELSRLGLAAATGTELDVVVGGLGLGYTAREALLDPRVRSLLVVEAVGEVISWQERGLLPDTAVLTTDRRVSFAEADFFALGWLAPGRTVDVVLLDVDHSPRNVLAPANAVLYTPDGLRALAGRLTPGGVFGLWSDDPPDDRFEAALAEVFATTATHVVPFANPITGGRSANTVYVATTHQPGAKAA